MYDFEQKYKEHFSTVYRACLVKFHNEDFAMEITQEAFYRAFLKLGDLREDEKFLPWVTTIALYYGYQKAKQDQQRYNPLPPDDLMGYALLSVAEEDTRGEETDSIRRWIRVLKESDQELFLMRHYYNMTYQAISEQTHIPLSTVKRRLAKMKADLRETMLAQRAAGHV
ncbi:MAG: sigma-70 family RNA polymerase sigma factor [Clostridiales bacterium]|nr:sigma-70 family RNA polymerase sigma factor [Clostridiales bacterium]